MPIKKIKHDETQQKHVLQPDVERAPDIEQKRQQFQDVVQHKKPKVVQVAKHHSHKKRSVIILVGALCVLLGSAVTAYAYFWYQKPETVVLQSIMNAANDTTATFKGTVTAASATATIGGGFSNGQSQVDASVDTGINGDLKTIKGTVLFDNDSTYLKVDKATSVLQQSMSKQQKMAVAALINLLKPQIDDQWIAINKDDIGSLSSYTRVSQCSVDVLERVTTDVGFRKSVLQLYSAHPFMQVHEQSTMQDMTGIYTLTINPTDFDAFMDTLYKSALFQDLAGCSVQNDGISAKELSGLSINLVIDKGNRSIEGMTFQMEGSTKISGTLEPDFNGAPQIVTPNQQDIFKFNDFKTSILNLSLPIAR